MQDLSTIPQAHRDSLIATLSVPRFARYLDACGGNQAKALQLYAWNLRVSQSLYPFLNAWEISLRNRLNKFLVWKYNGEDWIYDDKKAIRNLNRDNQLRLQAAIDRQKSLRNLLKPTNSSVVADLSVGFWVGLLGKSTDIPYAWRYNLIRVFPNDKHLTREAVSKRCEALLSLRNRVAHHEPIFHLDLKDLHGSLQMLVGGMCKGYLHLAEAACTFKDVAKENPLFPKLDNEEIS